MSEMIERVARALYRYDSDDPDYDFDGDPRGWAELRYRERAFAAIAAMDEPTAEMRQAYFEASGDRFQDNGWERAIAAALSQPEG